MTDGEVKKAKGGEYNLSQVIFKSLLVQEIMSTDVAHINGHSQLRDRADLDTSFLSLKKVHPNLESSRIRPNFNFAVVCLIFTRLVINPASFSDVSRCESGGRAREEGKGKGC